MNTEAIQKPRDYPRREIYEQGTMEAFSDGVIAMLITIRVLELKVPHNADPAALLPLVPIRIFTWKIAGCRCIIS